MEIMAYIEEPEIPAGMTVHEFRRTLPPRPRRRLRIALSHLRR